MIDIIIVIFFYLIGCVCAVVVAKHANKFLDKNDILYTEIDDLKVILFFSWFSVFTLLFSVIGSLISKIRLPEWLINWFKN